jgi:hypothetical protein
MCKPDMVNLYEDMYKKIILLAKKGEDNVVGQTKGQ